MPVLLIVRVPLLEEFTITEGCAMNHYFRTTAALHSHTSFAEKAAFLLKLHEVKALEPIGSNSTDAIH
jgi:hypothetical protein